MACLICSAHDPQQHAERRPQEASNPGMSRQEVDRTLPIEPEALEIVSSCVCLHSSGSLGVGT